MNGACPLCKQAAKDISRDFNRDGLHIVCERCGEFGISREASYNIRNLDTAFISCATRQASVAGRKILLDSKNIEVLGSEHSNASVEEMLDKFLLFLRLIGPRPGDRVFVNPSQDYPVADAASDEELQYIIDFAISQGLVDRVQSKYWLTPKGWAHLMGSSAGGTISGRCFVAMSFTLPDPNVYDIGIKPAIVECGYAPVCLSEVPTNEDINYRILSEIRKAQIVVADFTQLKAGVYFEAGFALGLGREVFWTCHKDDLSKLHFDTNHYQHLIWADIENLRQQLAEKIMAVAGPGPHRR